jgi:hypothetical protein
VSLVSRQQQQQLVEDRAVDSVEGRVHAGLRRRCSADGKRDGYSRSNRSLACATSNGNRRATPQVLEKRQKLHMPCQVRARSEIDAHARWRSSSARSMRLVLLQERRRLGALRDCLLERRDLLLQKR